MTTLTITPGSSERNECRTLSYWYWGFRKVKILLILKVFRFWVSRKGVRDLGQRMRSCSVVWSWGLRSHTVWWSNCCVPTEPKAEMWEQVRLRLEKPRARVLIGYLGIMGSISSTIFFFFFLHWELSKLLIGIWHLCKICLIGTCSYSIL